jgi:hypothetical protein
METVTLEDTDVIEDQALLLLGKSHEDMEDILGDFCGRLSVELDELGFPDDERRSLTTAVATLICERVAQWEAEGVGRA